MWINCFKKKCMSSMKKKILLLFLLSFLKGFSQVGIGTVQPDSSAQLDIVSVNKGILIPRVSLEGTNDQKTITTGNVNSLLVFNTASINDVVPGFYYWYSGKWIRLSDAFSDSLITNGKDGVGIVSTVNNGDGTFSIVYSDGKVFTSDNLRGPKGDAGVVGVEGMAGSSGVPGIPGSGLPGAPGEGITVVTNDDGVWVYNPGDTTWTNIKGLKGDKGDAGVVGVEGMTGSSGVPGIPGSGLPGAPGEGITVVTNDDGVWVYNPGDSTWTNIKGLKGDKGDKGDAGVVGVEGMAGTSGVPGIPGSGLPGAPGEGITVVTNDDGVWVYNPGDSTWTNINGLKGDKGDAGVGGSTKAGENIMITGLGTIEEPYVVSALNYDWNLLGNKGTDPNVNFLGTIDNKDLVFRTNNVRTGFINVDNLNFGFGYNVNSDDRKAYNYGNIYLGFESGKSLMSSSGSGNFYTTYIGYQSGFASKDALSSSFFGASAGQESLKVSNSVVLGDYSGYGLLDIKDSNIIGSGVGAYGTLVDKSNFIGYNAGVYARSIESSNFLGSYTGRSSSTVSGSNFIGDRSGELGRFVTHSNFIGDNSGYNTTGTDYSNFIGANAGYNTVTSDYCNFIGANAGYGSVFPNSIYIGSNAGREGTYTSLVGSSSILIGNNTYHGGFENSIALGTDAKNTASRQLLINNIDLVEISGKGAMKVPSGATDDRPKVLIFGQIRYNTTLGRGEMYVEDVNGDGNKGDFGWRPI
jgi:hypothetical protein